jgi:hypothetical protein
VTTDVYGNVTQTTIFDTFAIVNGKVVIVPKTCRVAGESPAGHTARRRFATSRVRNGPLGTAWSEIIS